MQSTPHKKDREQLQQRLTQSETRAPRVAGEKHAAASAEDIAEWKRAEEGLRRSERRFRSFVEATAHVIWRMNARGEADLPMPSWNAYTGQTVEEAHGLGWVNAIHPADRPRVMQAWQQASAEKRKYEVEYRLLRHGQEWRRILARGVPVLDDAGEIREYVGTCMDVTERREAEDALKRNEERLERLVGERTARLAETVRDLEAFSYSIAHDMRAPLRAMQSFAQILDRAHGQALPADSRGYLQRIQSAASRLDQLIQDVLSYSTVVSGEIPLAAVDSDRLIDEILQTYPNLRSRETDIEVQHPLPLVWANRAALTQVFSNLLENAVKFRKREQPAQVRVWAEEVEPGSGVSSSVDGLERKHGRGNQHWEREQSGRCVRFCVQDNGIGIEKEQQQQLFRLFQRVHRNGLYEGTGLGLAITKKAVERMGGRIGLQSSPDRGSTFWVELARAE